MKLKILIGLLAGILLTANITSAAEIQSGAMNADSSVLKEATVGASVLGQLSKGAAVNIIDRNGGWMKVQAGSTTGWVKAIVVKRDVKSGGASDVAAVVSGRGATGQVVSTSGTRGLDAETLKSAKFNQTEIDALERQKVDKATAHEFAKSVNLNPAELQYPQSNQ
jgi:hypothetical protein